MAPIEDFNTVPEGLPEPIDDGATDHLPGCRVPSIPLRGTNSAWVDLATRSGTTVVFIYPRTGRPGQALPTGWNEIPGARGCTPQTCGFRDHYAEMQALGAAVYGLSTQDSSYQQEAAQRLHLPFPLLSDSNLEFARALSLPTFQVDGMTLIKRLALVLKQGRIDSVFYPVFPPDRNATDVLTYLKGACDQRT